MLFEAVRAEFFASHLRYNPEDATTLGVHEFDRALRDNTPASLEGELRFYESALVQLSTFPSSSLAPRERLDLASMTSIARFLVHAMKDLQQHERSLELSAYPQATLAHHSAHAESEQEWQALIERLSQVPRAYREQEDNLARGLARGWVPDTTLVSGFEGDVLPGAARFFDELPLVPGAHHGLTLSPADTGRLERAARDARDVVLRHREWLARELSPHARDAFALGEEEVRFRLQCCFGIETSPSDLIGAATGSLREAQRELVVLATRVAGGSAERPLALDEAGKVFRALFAVHPTSLDEAQARYRAILERATAFIGERKMFRVPSDFQLRFKVLPPGMASGASAVNWPAPLLDPRKKGHFVIGPDLAAHSMPVAANLTVHEGIPGHYLQSLVWQQTFSRASEQSSRASPVGFLYVTDDVAMSRQYFGPMLNIEGFAAYAEELMLEAGFYSDEEALLAVVSKAIRAVRVIVDLGLHTERLTTEEAVRTIVEETTMPEGWARGQIARYKRIPLQAVTYHLGCVGIWRLKAAVKAMRGAAFTEVGFHDAFFALGTAPPDLARPVEDFFLSRGFDS